jgi:WD40 repeat protein
LEWIHGYSAFKVGPSAVYAADSSIIYPAATLCVKSTDTGASKAQEYFTAHDDDVISMALSADRRFLATGQVGSKKNKGKASVVIWDTGTCRPLQRLDACHERGVSTLSFSPDGLQLLTVGQDNSNTHTVFIDKGGLYSKVVKACSAASDKAPVSSVI